VHNKDRYAALDLSRFIAAIIVFSGHMFFLPKKIQWSSEALELLSPIRTGAFAVLFFFTLSGFVLTIDESRPRYFDWTKRRLIRLYPVYIAAWLTGLLLVAAYNFELLSIKTVVLGLLGVQSLSKESSMVVNAPLWSLSIEIISATFLFYLIRLRNQPQYLVLILSVNLLVLFNYSSATIYKALPYFIIGIILRNQKFNQIKINRSFINVFFIFGTIYYLILGASQISALPNNFAGEIYSMVGCALLLILFSRFHVKPKRVKIAIALGKRSFCLYAFHYPVLLVFNYFLDPSTVGQFALYCVLSIASTAIVSELSFRLLDLPSISASQRRY